MKIVAKLLVFDGQDERDASSKYRIENCFKVERFTSVHFDLPQNFGNATKEELWGVYHNVDGERPVAYIDTIRAIVVNNLEKKHVDMPKICYGV